MGLLFSKGVSIINRNRSISLSDTSESVSDDEFQVAPGKLISDDSLAVTDLKHQAACVCFYPSSMQLVALDVSAIPVTQPAAADEGAQPHESISMAPIFASPLHAEDSLAAASKAVSPPMFMTSFETTEETLPFQLSLKSSSPASEVVVTPVAGAEALPQEQIEEVKEELVELELEAELKWVKR